MTKVKNVELTGRLCEATLKAVNDKWTIAMREPGNCSTWAEIMRAGSVAHESLLVTGRAGAPPAVRRPGGFPAAESPLRSGDHPGAWR